MSEYRDADLNRSQPYMMLAKSAVQAAIDEAVRTIEATCDAHGVSAEVSAKVTFTGTTARMTGYGETAEVMPDLSALDIPATVPAEWLGP